MKADPQGLFLGSRIEEGSVGEFTVSIVRVLSYSIETIAIVICASVD